MYDSGRNVGKVYYVNNKIYQLSFLDDSLLPYSWIKKGPLET